MDERRITAAVARAPGEPFSIEELSLTGPAADEVLVKIVATGLCHTDLTIKDTPLPPNLPAVLGHEGAGIVAAIGEEAKANFPHIGIGHRVVLSFASCGTCAYCHDDEPSYCDHARKLNYSGKRKDGESALRDNVDPVASHFFGQSSFATYACVYPRNIIPAPDDVALELLGPFGCSILTGAGAVIQSLKAKAGESILITGAGAVGLSAVLAARVQGCTTIIASDPLLARRALAIELGATHAVDPSEEKLKDGVYGICKRGVDRALDTTGRRDVLEASVNVLAKRGVLATVAIAPSKAPTFEVDINALMGFGRRLIGVVEGDSDPRKLIPKLLAHHQNGAFPFEKLITTYPLRDINRAIEEQAAGLCVKPVLMMPD